MTQGRDYYPDRPTAKPLKPSNVVPSATYIERGQRWMEKEEAFSLRQAMEDMELRDQPEKANQVASDSEDPAEQRLYEAALDEAAELVWQHQNPGKVPQPGAPYRYKPHMRKDSYAHARAASAGIYGEDVAPTGLARDPSMRSVSGSSTDSAGRGDLARSRPSFASSRQMPAGGESGRSSLEGSIPTVHQPRVPKSYGSISGSSSGGHGGRRRSSMKRNISGEIQKPFSGDQIWEEPDGHTSSQSELSAHGATVQPLRMKPKNPLNRVQFAPGVPAAVESPPAPVSKYEIYKNPPSQSRNPQYTVNTDAPPPPVAVEVPRKHGVEIRSEDIRQATSMKLKDRSPKLPTPSAVSDTPGRPIVSFDKNWKPQEEATDTAPEEPRAVRGSKHSAPSIPSRFSSIQQPQQHQPAQAIPSISVTEDIPSSYASAPAPSRRPLPFAPSRQVRDGPSIPTIAISDSSSPSIPTIAISDSSTPSIPTIAVSDSSRPSIPTIVLPDDMDDSPSAPGIPIIVTPDDKPTTSRPSARPLPTPQPGAPRVRQAARPQGHWTPARPPAGSRATAICHECGDFIEGRFVSLAGTSERFHPHCFVCYSCGTSLEALEISPEPDAHREARLDRIARRARGERLAEEPGQTMGEDGDARMRFYCHLDWHEQFAPRCKHCKTPIMGEHVVALGSHWHFGHFFCAECGDPFERGMTHIEKDGYAWCVGCQTKRTERRAPKCKMCKKAVIGQYVQALGGEWHDECFRCATCKGGFDDGQVFPRGNSVLCTRCMERELKM